MPVIALSAFCLFSCRLFHTKAVKKDLETQFSQFSDFSAFQRLCQLLNFSTVLTEMSFVFACLPTSLQVSPISYLADLTLGATTRTGIVPSIIPKYHQRKHQK